jgi:hypothetical protein
MTRTALLLGVMMLAVPTATQAQAPFPSPFDTRGTPEDQRACNGDARKFCRKVLADDMAVLRCFQQNRHKLSRACQAVLKKYNQ